MTKHTQTEIERVNRRERTRRCTHAAAVIAIALIVALLIAHFVLAVERGHNDLMRDASEYQPFGYDTATRL